MVYLVFLVLGIYFINQGGVLERYWNKKTIFAESDEDVSELPTIVTWSQVLQKLEFGKDFNLSYGAIGYEQTNLSLGQNTIKGKININVSLENIYWNENMISNPHVFKITPTRYSKEMSINYKLTYTFKNDTVINPNTRVLIALMSENNSVSIEQEITFKDGDTSEKGSGPGLMSFSYVTPERYTFVRELHHCRVEPFSELLLKKMAELLTENVFNCTPCLKTSYGKHLNQVWSRTQFYSVDFSKSRIDVKKCVFNKPTIKVCVSCC